MTKVGWLGVRERVAAVAAAEASRRIFGASGHHFVLYPALTVAEIAEMEQVLGVCLPEEYRSFLLEVGTGGAGPGYGIERVERTSDGWRWTGHGDTTVTKLGVAFQPFDPRVYAEHNATEPVEEHFPNGDSFTAASRAWMQHLNALYEEETFGSIAIAHQGCGCYWRLVVSGPDHGIMWDDGRASDAPLSPCTGSARERLTFGRWYLAWLTQVETALTRTGRA